MERAENVNVPRRNFLRVSALAVGSAFVGLKRYSLTARTAASPSTLDRHGPLVPDPDGIIDLPKGFSYRILSKTGDPMADGLVVPGFFDGMGAFTAPDGKVILVRNHELESKGLPIVADRFRRAGPFGADNELFERVDAAKLYDVGSDRRYPSLGGTTTLVYDPVTGETVREYLSLAGTERNCAGGITPWGTWLSCEESDARADGDFLADHGYVFEVEPSLEPVLTSPVAYEEMGRFRREAVAVDPLTGIVYQTEDRRDGLFYRFIPNEPGKLGRGGRLQALALVDPMQTDTRNWRGSGSPSFPEGEPQPARWIDMDDPHSPRDDLRERGREAGGTVFARGEGIWYGDGVLFFACTSGGHARLGQIFKYTPSPAEGEPGESSAPGELELFLESTDGNAMQGADNLTIAPWGDLIVCEDRSSGSHLRSVAADGTIETLAFNALNGTEFAGACFAPGQSTLFVNIQKPGLTLAIDGPFDASS